MAAWEPAGHRGYAFAGIAGAILAAYWYTLLQPFGPVSWSKPLVLILVTWTVLSSIRRTPGHPPSERAPWAWVVLPAVAVLALLWYTARLEANLGQQPTTLVLGRYLTCVVVLFGMYLVWITVFPLQKLPATHHNRGQGKLGLLQVGGGTMLFVLIAARFYVLYVRYRGEQAAPLPLSLQRWTATAAFLTCVFLVVRTALPLVLVRRSDRGREGSHETRRVVRPRSQRLLRALVLAAAVGLPLLVMISTVTLSVGRVAMIWTWIAEGLLILCLALLSRGVGPSAEQRRR